MPIELAGVPEAGGVMVPPHARIVPLSSGPQSYTAAVDRYLTAAGISESSARVYRISLTNWCWLLAGAPTPLGPSRREAKPPALALSVLDDPDVPERLAELAAQRADAVDAGTVNRELSVVRKAVAWWRRQGWKRDRLDPDRDPFQGPHARGIPVREGAVSRRCCSSGCAPACTATPPAPRSARSGECRGPSRLP